MAAHLAIEGSVRFLDDDACEADFDAYLARQLGFYEPVEQRLCALCAAAAKLDIEQRIKSPLIARDLLALGHTPRELATLSRCAEADLPALTNLQQALGCLYVLEGATLGGRYVHHRLALRHPELVARAGSFLRCYGSETRARWLEFAQALAAYAEDAETILGAAQQTFSALHKWLIAERPRTSQVAT